MTKKRIFIVSLLAALLVGGCSSVEQMVRQPSASKTFATLAAAGVHIEPTQQDDLSIDDALSMNLGWRDARSTPWWW